MISMIGKDEIWPVIVKAVNTSVDLIKTTYGPAGNKVIVSKILHKGIFDDGVQIARDLELSNDQENAVFNVIRETAIKTNDRAGDGTTGSLIMLQAIINEVAKLGTSQHNGRLIEKQLKAGFEEAKKQLLSQAKPVSTKADLERVARISFDDEKVSKLIAEAWFILGKEGALTVDRSGTMETEMELAEGLKIDRGFVSPYMVTNPQRMEAVVEKPYILLTDYRLTEANDVLCVMNALAEKQILNLVMICEHIEGAALATLIVNKVQGKFNAIAIDAPMSGDERTTLLEDIAIMTGAKVFSQNKGDKLEEIKLEDLGRAQRFVSKKDSSVIIDPKGNKKVIKESMDALKKAIESATSERDKARLKNRLAMFGGKVGVIKVGAATESEERALRYKVEDAINATLSAYKGGVVAGGGIALGSLKTSSEVLNAALKKPFEQLKVNVQLPNHEALKKGDAINVVTGKTGPFMEVGVMDPVDVLIAGVESAVSIATLLITTSGMICEPPQKHKEE